MATPLAVNDIIECLLVCKADPQYSINVRHYRVSVVGGTPATVADVASTVEDTVSDAYKVCLSSHASWHGVKATRIKPTRSQPEVSFTDRNPGESDDDLLTRQVAGVIRLKTALGGRSGRGRAYIPFATELFNSDVGEPTGAYLTALQGVANVLDDDLVITVAGRSATLVAGVYSKKLNSFNPITSFELRTHWGTQRRRSSINRPDADPLGL